MSGWYPHVRGHRTMFHMLRPDEPVLLRTLKDNGYYVWWGGKNDLVPGQNGYEDYCDVKYKPERRPSRIWELRPRGRVARRPGARRLLLVLCRPARHRRRDDLL